MPPPVEIFERAAITPGLPEDPGAISRALIRARLRALSQQNRLIARGEREIIAT